MKKITFTLLLLPFLLLMACESNTARLTENDKPANELEAVDHPDWSRDAIIYEVNLRQFTPEGTMQAFIPHIPRLKKMGVKILWLMPIHPIGMEKRKAGEDGLPTLGSYYSVRDYTAVNPEFGNFDDFKALVDAAHAQGMYVILDWVANHTAWDHAWMTLHPEWYTRDSLDEIVSPFDWTDVADLNFDDNPELWDAMIDALKYWVVEADLDGYRCDVAGMVPTAFWNRARMELDSLKPVFMLAEAEQVDHMEKAFDMNYGWEMHHIMNQIAKKEMPAKKLWSYFRKNDSLYPADAYRMYFITNHDENSWNGTVRERMGEGGPAFALLTYTVPGMPLIYSGQEVSLDKRLRFFEKDTIYWDRGIDQQDFYTRLGALKKDHEALQAGVAGGKMTRIKNTAPDQVFSFTRETKNDKLIVVINLSEQAVDFSLESPRIKGEFKNFFSGEEVSWQKEQALHLEPWAYIVLVNE